MIPNPNALTQGDTAPLVGTITDSNGAVNLAGCTVELKMKSLAPGGHAPITGDCDVLQSVDGDGAITARGRVSYSWAAGETDTPGVYGLRWVVTFGNGKTRSFPNDRLVTFEITPA